jgi:putative membrane protein
MQKTLLLTTIISLSTSAAVCAKIAPASTLKSADKQFMHNRALDGMTEIQLGQAAEKRAYKQEIKDFAAKMVTDHTKANESLEKLANEKGVTLPSALDAKHNAIVAKFSKLRGAKFDHDYIEEILKDHKKAVTVLETEKQKGEPDLKNWCKETLPTIQEHLAMAQDINKTIERK